MLFTAQQLPYQQTHYYSRLVLDYLSKAESLRPFYNYTPDLAGLQQSIEGKKKQKINRALLVQELEKQYESVIAGEKVKRNIELLKKDTTFSICTAHQPNLFTGPLYFIYKILHVIKLAENLNEKMPEYNFVPVYYMGSEDADFAELNHTYVDGKRIEWQKQQSGAVGRMLVDKTLIQLIDELKGQLIVEPHGAEVIELLQQSYVQGKDIQTATFELVNKLYGKYGLVVLIPDNAALKAEQIKVFTDDIFNGKPSEIVQQTSVKLGEHYKVQAFPREINLFYLKDNIRERIIEEGGMFKVNNTDIILTAEEIKNELEAHPERFSPNVILRGLFQETILPNIAFIGGGGELAYWLQLKDLFHHYQVNYPVLILRNSFLVIEEKWSERINRLKLSVADLFLPEDELMKQIVLRSSGNAVLLNGNFEKAEELYELVKSQAEHIDPTLAQYATAIKVVSLKKLKELEKKMLRAEKRKFSDQQNQVHKLRARLFPNNNLQERVENFSSFFAKWGEQFIDELYRNSLTLEQEFCVLSETEH